MEPIILGTAGHIDHGKTSLIKVLTGTDTDRLPEEKRRGITIELGFASLNLPSGQHLGIVDVPGHEKFVKNMVAGATGIDLVVMVIAADEGIMPQTREHMEICTLLNISLGVIALTKIDLIDEEWLELVSEDIQKFTKGTFLENAPIVPVSSNTGQGISEFIKTLDELAKKVDKRSSSGLFRIPVDRVFTMKGFGTVITGTLISGHFRVGDTIMIYPSCITSKVRGIQVHNLNVDEAYAGMRTAINFQGLEKASVNRGDIIAYPNSLRPSYMLDASFNFLKSNEKPIKNRTSIRFHAGTSEILANLILIDREELLPGESAVVQIRLDSPISLVKDDRFVIRSYSPVRTIGGGYIINPIPEKHKRFKSDIIEGLNTLINHDNTDIISYHVRESDYMGISFSDLKIMTNLSEKDLNQVLQDLLSKKVIIQIDKENLIFIHADNLKKVKIEVTGYLDKYHSSNPLKEGMPKEELKSKLPCESNPKLFNIVINQMNKEGNIVHNENTIRLSNHLVSLKENNADVKEKILKAYLDGGLTPPYFKDLTKVLNIDSSKAKDILMFIVEKGSIIKIKEDLYFHSDAIKKLKTKLIEFLIKNSEISTPEFKNMTGASRKFVIPLIEYFDSTNVTIRVGDIRKLRKVS